MTKATHPLDLPTTAPPCYSSQKAWELYRRGASSTGANGFTYCTDCTPEHKAKMERQGRCAYPGTIFVAIAQVTVGRRRVVQ